MRRKLKIVVLYLHFFFHENLNLMHKRIEYKASGNSPPPQSTVKTFYNQVTSGPHCLTHIPEIPISTTFRWFRVVPLLSPVFGIFNSFFLFGFSTERKTKPRNRIPLSWASIEVSVLLLPSPFLSIERDRNSGFDSIWVYGTASEFHHSPSKVQFQFFLSLFLICLFCYEMGSLFFWVLFFSLMRSCAVVCRVFCKFSGK